MNGNQVKRNKIDQFTMQGIFGVPTGPIGIPKSAIVLWPHWQYIVKHSGISHSQM